MPNQSTIQRARKDAKKGKPPTAQAGEFVRKVIDDVRKGKHGVRSAKQAIAIGLSEARRAGVKLPPPPKGTQAAKHPTHPSHKKPSPRRSRAVMAALKREPQSTVSPEALSQQTRKAAAKRGAQNKKQAAKKAVRTKGSAGLRRAAQKAAHTRHAH